MLKSLKLEGIGPVRGLSAVFGERLNVLTGDNGLGKSFLLDVCFWSLTGTWPGGRTALPVPNGKKQAPTITYEIKGKAHQRKEPKTASFEFASQTWTRPKGRPFKPGLVIYASVDGGFAVWDPARNYWRDPTSGIKEGEEQPRAYQFTPDTLANGLKDGARLLCNGLVQDWVNWYYEQDTGNSSSSSSELEPIIRPFHYLEEVVSSLSHPSEPMSCGEPKRVYVDQPRKYPVLSLPYGDVAYPQWSAGVRRVISLAYLVVWTWYEHVQAAELRNEDPTNRLILIVDEIESHLHPRWQRTILPALLQVVQKLHAQIEVQVISATHSPLILASLEPHFDTEKDKLFWFELNDKAVHFTDYPWANQGDVVGWLTSEIFGLRQARSREGEIAIEAAEAFMRGDLEKMPDGLKTKEAIHHALKQALPGLDPFWPRWIVEVKP
jgi:hypothetical protein